MFCWLAERGIDENWEEGEALVWDQVKWIPTQKESVMRPWCFLCAIIIAKALRTRDLNVVHFCSQIMKLELDHNVLKPFQNDTL